MIKLVSPLILMILAGITLIEAGRETEKIKYRLAKTEACLWTIIAMLAYIAFCK